MSQRGTALLVTWITLLLLLPGTGYAGDAPYHWTISASSTDPFDNTAAFVGGLNTYYLWLESCDLPDPLQDGMAVAEFDIFSDGIVHLVTTTMNGFLNAGGVSNLLLAVGSCPCGPVVAASLLVVEKAPGTMCITASAQGNLLTADCEQPEPGAHDMTWTGLGVGIPPPDQCSDFSGACCFDDGTCADVASPSECSALGGTFQGVGSDCAGVECTATVGACCFAGGACQAITPEDCADLGGNFLGKGSSCNSCPPPPSVGFGLGWTISTSPTDPFQNTAAFPPSSVQTVYLWLACANLPPDAVGMSAAEFSLAGTGIVPLDTNMVNGFLNAGSPTDLLLAVGGCPTGPVVAAELTILALPGNLCLTPSPGGSKVMVNCDPQPEVFPFDWIGLDNGLAPCGKGQFVCEIGGPTSLDEESWGAVKARYR